MSSVSEVPEGRSVSGTYVLSVMTFFKKLYLSQRILIDRRESQMIPFRKLVIDWKGEDLRFAVSALLGKKNLAKVLGMLQRELGERIGSERAIFDEKRYSALASVLVQSSPELRFLRELR